MGRSLAVVWMSGVLMCSATTNFAQDDFELDDLLAGIPVWDQLYNVRLGLGYNDNLLLSDLNEERSAMIVSGFDITVFRLPIDDNHFNVFANLESRMYPDGDAISGEATALALVQAKHDLNEKWQGGLTGQYFYQDQVIDASVTEVNVSTLPVKGSQFEAATEWRYQVASRHWLEADANGTRQVFLDEVLDDYWQYGAALTYGYSYGNRSEFLAGYEVERRLYDTRNQFDSTGNAIAGTELKYLYQNVELGSKHYFDVDRRWRLYTRVGYGRNTDNGSGYFDFNRYNASVQCRYQNDLWEITVRGRFNFYDYRLQESDETPGEERVRATLGGGVRVERVLVGDLTGFVDYEYENVESNLSYDKYSLNLVSAGVDWEF